MAIKDFRKQQKLTQAQFAEKLKVSRITIVRYEADPSSIGVSFLKDLMDAFGLTLSEAWEVIYGKGERDD